MEQDRSCWTLWPRISSFAGIRDPEPLCDCLHTAASEESTTERLCCWPPLRVSDDLHRISVRVCDMETCIALVYWVSPSLLQILRLKHSYESGVSWPCSSR